MRSLPSLPWTCAVLLASACVRPAAPPVELAPSDVPVADGGAAPSPAEVDPDAGLPACQRYASPVNEGPLEEPALVELSGLAASRLHPGVLYAHNDSGDSPRFFAVGASGKALGEFRLGGARASDWEDVAVGPCPQGSCVFLGDIGDNRQVRNDYAIYRVAEPNVAADRPAGVVTVDSDWLPFQYPGGAHFNAETLLVHPQSGDVYVVTKRPSGLPSTVYRLPAPHTPGRLATLVEVAALDFPAAGDTSLTGGDIHPSGRSVLLRTYTHLYELSLVGPAPFEAVFSAERRELPLAAELQGEAVAWMDARRYVTASEGPKPFLHVVACGE